MNAIKMYDLYECEPILRMPSNVKIKKCIRKESQNDTTLVMYCNNYHILCYNLNKFNNNVIIRQIPIDRTKGELRSMSFNDSGSHIIIIVSNSKIFIIPIEKLLALQNHMLLRDDSVVIENCSLTNPTAIVWWNSLDQFNQLAIVGNDFGEISFINIKTKKEIGGTYVQNSVKYLNIIKDRNSVSLIICCKNETQFRLILEETRSKANSNTKFETQYKNQTQDNSYFNCFITSSDEKETIGPNNCWNFKPTLIDMFNENYFQEYNEIIATNIIYQNPVILTVSEVMSEKEEFGQIVIRITSNNEFDYSFSSFLTKNLIPKSSPLPIESVILTDRLFFVYTSKSCSLVSREFSDSRKLAKLNSVVQEFKFNNELILNSYKLIKLDKFNEKSDDSLDSFLIITSECIYVCHQKQSCQQLFNSIITTSPLSGLSDCSSLVKAQRLAPMLGLNINDLYENCANACLEKRQFSSAVRFYQLAKTAQIKRIANFVSFGYFTEVIAYIQVLFSSKCFEVEESDRMHFANIVVNCLVQQILEKSLRSEESDTKNTLKIFLRDCVYYDESVVLRLFVEQGLYDMAHYCAQIRAQFGLLLSYLLKSSYLRSKSLNEHSYETVMKSDYKELMVNTSDCLSYLNCFTSPQITYSLILHKDLIAKYLRFVVKLLPNLEMIYLNKLALIFDPRRSATQLLLNRVLTHLKQNYLTNEEIEEQIIQKKDVLNFFIFVTLMILRQNGFVSAFSEKYISIEPFIKETENTNKRRFVVESVVINAGFSHSAYIRNGCLYLWGKSQFGCFGLQTQDFTNISKQIPNPKRLDLFKEVLSISVKAVSCGAKHTLVLTDFGVYAFGSSQFGQLGLGKDVVLSRNPIIINDLVNKDIIRIECGQYHSLAITCDGLLLTWGWGLHSQLGHNHNNDIFTPQVVEYLKTKTIIHAFGGYAHTIALDSDGIVYSFGSGTYGQLGLGTNGKHNIPQKLTLLSEPIAQISTKYFHSLALSRDTQTLYIWGSNPQSIRFQAHVVRKSRLNQKPNQLIANFTPNQDYLKPTKVDTSSISGRITKICSGSLHSLILSSEGEVYSFGRGIDGQLGHGKVKEVKTPMKIVAMNDIHVVDIAAGHDFSLAVDITGTIWGWGQNSESQIGPKSNTQNCSAIGDKSKISIKTNRRLITLVTGGKCLELSPIRINVLEDIESYCDSLNYSLDINAMKTSTKFSIIDGIQTLNDENSVSFDHQIIASLLAFYKQELDLNSVLNRCKDFKCLQMCAFVCELQNDFSKAFDFQLQALQMSLSVHIKHLISICGKLFCTFVTKAIESVEQISKILEILYKFWIENEFTIDSFEEFLEKCYKFEIKDSMFGISFFNFLKINQNINVFHSKFLLEMVDFTIKSIANKPEKLFAYQTNIEMISADIESVSFPSEKLWQNILTYFHTNQIKTEDNIGVEIELIEDEIILFGCNHYYGLNDLKVTILPVFENDIKQIEGINANEAKNLLKLFNDSNKDLSENMCPKCVISSAKSKHF